MRKLKIFTFAIIAVSVLATGAFCADSCNAASPQKEAWAGKREARQQQLYKDLNLTDNQKKALDENKAQTREQVKALFQQMKDKTALLRQELQNDTLNMEKVNQINGELKNLQAQILDQKLQGILGVRKILTPEQFRKFMTETQSRPGRSKNKWQGMHKGEKNT